MAHFFPSYSFDLDQTLYFFTSGRYEFRNKGMDLTLEALARLNWRLKQAGSPVTVVFFLVTKAPVRHMSLGLLECNTRLRDLQMLADKLAEQVSGGLAAQLAAGGQPDPLALMSDALRVRLRRAQLAWQRSWLPPVVTHDIIDDAGDPVLAKLRACGLCNRPEDPVKVVYHPDFINPTNPLFFGLDYDDFVRGCHLGVFPSLYEPWGYTPLECLAMGVPAVTCDLAGFGAYAASLPGGPAETGLYMVHRRGRSDHDAAEELARHMFSFCSQDRRQRISQRNLAENHAQHFGWNRLVRHYDDAHALALARGGT